MKTTVHIPDSLLAQARKMAAREHTSVKELIVEGLRRLLKERNAPGPPFRLRRATFKGEGLQPGAAGGSWERLRDLSYEGRGD